MIFDALGSSDILFIIDTHAILVWPLLEIIAGYHWSFACRQETRFLGSVAGLGGVGCLTRDSLQNRVSLVVLDEFARFMWI